MVCYSDLANHYRLTFALHHYHSFSITEINEMMPYEKDIYISMIQKILKSKEGADTPNDRISKDEEQYYR